MKKAILILFCFIFLVSTASCVTKKENNKSDTHMSEPQTTVSDTPHTISPCSHTFGEWRVSKEATEREDGEEKRACSLCEYFETKPIHAKGTEGLAFTLSEDGTSYSVNAGSATEGDVVIPAYHNGLPVTSIGYIGFADSDNEPEGFEVGTYAFFNCTNLKSVVIPATVNVIGDAAFTMCEALEHIVIPESVTEIGKYAFALTMEDIFNKYHDDIRISVPHSEVILILREWQAWGASGVEIYYLDEYGSEVFIADTYFDNGASCPFSQGKFEIINRNDGTFTVRAGNSYDKAEWMERTFDLPQCTSASVSQNKDGILVFYGGKNIEEWNAIDVASEGNKKLLESIIYYYNETTPTEVNKFWYYIDGIPTLW